MEGRRGSKQAKIILIVVLAVIVLVFAAGAAWWKTMSDLSRQSLTVFASELDEAARDSSFSRADLELMEQLRAIAASKEASLLGRSLCGGVGMAPLLRGSIFPEDRLDMEAVRDALAPKHGNLSFREANAFWAANPRLQQTFRGYNSLVKQAMARRKVEGARPGADR